MLKTGKQRYVLTKVSTVVGSRTLTSKFMNVYPNSDNALKHELKLDIFDIKTNSFQSVDNMFLSLHYKEFIGYHADEVATSTIRHNPLLFHYVANIPKEVFELDNLLKYKSCHTEEDTFVDVVKPLTAHDEGFDYRRGIFNMKKNTDSMKYKELIVDYVIYLVQNELTHLYRLEGNKISICFYLYKDYEVQKEVYWLTYVISDMSKFTKYFIYKG